MFMKVFFFFVKVWVHSTSHFYVFVIKHSLICFICHVYIVYSWSLPRLSTLCILTMLIFLLLYWTSRTYIFLLSWNRSPVFLDKLYGVQLYPNSFCTIINASQCLSKYIVLKYRGPKGPFTNSFQLKIGLISDKLELSVTYFYLESVTVNLCPQKQNERVLFC